MRDIDNHAQLLHALNKKKALFCQSVRIIKHRKASLYTASGVQGFRRFFGNQIRKRKFIWIIPCERHHACPKMVQRLKMLRLSLAASPLLYCHQGRYLSFLLVPSYFIVCFYDTDVIFIFFHLGIKDIYQLQHIRKRVNSFF